MKFPLTRKLSPTYRSFCLFETVAINSIGCGSLAFQNQLRDALDYPGLYQYWFVAPIPSTEAELLLSYMLAGWLAVAGILQGAINLNDHSSKNLKYIALYTFGACDWLWIILIMQHMKLLSLYHIIGTIITVSIRQQYLVAPHKIFDDSLQLNCTINATRTIEKIELKHARGAIVMLSILMSTLQFNASITALSSQPWFYAFLLGCSILELHSPSLNTMSALELRSGRIAMLCVMSVFIYYLGS